MTPRILVAGIGNIFLSDDGFGPEVVRRIAADAEVVLPDNVRVVDYGIRGMHLAYDLLDGYAALVLVDAVPGNGSPGDINVLEVRESDLDGDLSSGEIDAHGMEPVSVLASLDKLGGTLPRTYVVGCRPASVEEDIGLSEPVAAAVPTAVRTVLDLVQSLVELVETPAPVEPHAPVEPVETRRS